MNLVKNVLKKLQVKLRIKSSIITMSAKSKFQQDYYRMFIYIYYDIIIH